MTLFLLHCPNCKNRMKYQSASRNLEGKRKTCVYCGKSFKVRDNLLKEL